jgi:hypothetical protein
MIKQADACIPAVPLKRSIDKPVIKQINKRRILLMFTGSMSMNNTYKYGLRKPFKTPLISI